METYFDDLRESNEFLNLLLDNMNSAVLIADENLKIHHFNDGFLHLFAKSKEDVIERFGGGFGLHICGRGKQGLWGDIILRRMSTPSFSFKNNGGRSPGGQGEAGTHFLY